ncbi:MAG: hypothetical protein M3Z19_17465, partial [Chloroflexota bacterium]|nr:hypothetical protein [Chloroflexota bacterium]
MISGARIGQPTWLRRLVARAESHVLTAFVAPGREIARVHGLDLAAVGLAVVSSPRRANVLVLVGDLPEGLVQPTAVAYAQMARPRAILAIGTAPITSLPTPDVTVALDQAALSAGIADLRRRFAVGVWAPDAAAFAIDITEPHNAMDHGGHDHQMMQHGGHGEMPMTGHGQHDVMQREDLPSEPHDMPMDHAMHHHADQEMTPDTPMTHGDHPASAARKTDDPHGAMQHGMHGDMAMGQSRHGAMATPDDHAMAAQPHHDPHMAMEHDTHVSDMRVPMASPTEHVGDHDATVPMDNGEHQQHDAAMEHDMVHGNMSMPMPTDPGEETGHDAHGSMNMPMTPGDHGNNGGMAMDMDMDMDMDMSGGFMSMVAMTQDLPRSRDGLPMEWAEAPFGPLFPGLPGGLALTLTLDGDTVARAKATSGAVHRGLAATWAGPTTGFPDRLALLDPQTPVAYRVLASRALEDAAAFTINDAVARHRVGALERERALSHLGWLADFAALLGDRWLAERAVRLQFALLRATDDPGASRVGREIAAFVRRAQRLPLLKQRLNGIGHDASHAAETVQGPFARACGMTVDARRNDPAYRALGFAP